MGGNIAGIYGAQIFRQDDRPRYRRGFSINIAILVVGLILAALRYADDVVRRRRASKINDDSASDEGSSEPKAARPSDIQPAPVLLDRGAVVGDSVKV